MAIHEDVEGIEVTVCMNGETMQEYEAEAEQSTHASPVVSLHEDMWTVSKYIEAVTDQNFSVRFKISPEYQPTSHHLGFEVLLDGVRVWEPLIDSVKHEMFPYSTMVHGAISGERGGYGTLRKFKFSAIETESNFTNSRDVSKQRERMNQVGEITVKVRRYDRGYALGGTASVDKKLGDHPAKVHEKALKGDAKSHGITLGTAEATHVPNFTRCIPIDGADFPITIFKFKYRSKEALKQLYIIERTPSPSPDILVGLTAADRREMQAMAERLRKRRLEPDAPIKSEHAFVKREEGSKRRRTDTIVIDLTADSDEEDDDGSGSGVTLR